MGLDLGFRCRWQWTMPGRGGGGWGSRKGPFRGGDGPQICHGVEWGVLICALGWGGPGMGVGGEDGWSRDKLNREWDWAGFK